MASESSETSGELGLGSAVLDPSGSLDSVALGPSESSGEPGLGLVMMLELSSRESSISSKVGSMCVPSVSIAFCREMCCRVV